MPDDPSTPRAREYIPNQILRRYSLNSDMSASARPLPQNPQNALAIACATAVEPCYRFRRGRRGPAASPLIGPQHRGTRYFPLPPLQWQLQVRQRYPRSCRKEPSALWWCPLPAPLQGCVGTTYKSIIIATLIVTLDETRSTDRSNYGFGALSLWFPFLVFDW